MLPICFTLPEFAKEHDDALRRYRGLTVDGDAMGKGSIARYLSSTYELFACGPDLKTFIVVPARMPQGGRGHLPHQRQAPCGQAGAAATGDQGEVTGLTGGLCFQASLRAEVLVPSCSADGGRTAQLQVT